MQSSLQKVSIGKIILTIILFLILIVLCTMTVISVIPDSYTQFFDFLIDSLFYFSVLLASIYHLHKNNIRVFHLIGEKKIELKIMLYFLFLLLIGTIVSITSLFFFLR
ncbi:hypothetical protein GCM10008932_22150 [Alkalibacterium iburiense]|uniref:Uncharacterized protein n=1 Tax=Alkalibacterium iburiense TaxID=290589 RepID=A0ABP3HJH3_9LACT